MCTKEPLATAIQKYGLKILIKSFTLMRLSFVRRHSTTMDEQPRTQRKYYAQIHYFGRWLLWWYLGAGFWILKINEKTMKKLFLLMLSLCAYIGVQAQGKLSAGREAGSTQTRIQALNCIGKILFFRGEYNHILFAAIMISQMKRKLTNTGTILFKGFL